MNPQVCPQVCPCRPIGELQQLLDYHKKNFLLGLKLLLIIKQRSKDHAFTFYFKNIQLFIATIRNNVIAEILFDKLRILSLSLKQTDTSFPPTINRPMRNPRTKGFRVKGYRRRVKHHHNHVMTYHVTGIMDQQL